MNEASLGENKSVIMDAHIDGVSAHMLKDQTFTEVSLTESLLSPALLTVIHLQDVVMTNPMKNYDEYKGKNFLLSAANPNLPGFQLDVNNVIYRLAERKPFDRNIENYKLYATDKTLLLNHTVRISKQYQKQTPSAIVQDALGKISPSAIKVEQTTPVRDYVARNVHPFEVIYDQANYALARGNDPSLLHYMTYENGGTHHFRSIKELTSQGVVAKYRWEDKGFGEVMKHTYNILSFEFPCEFDLLSDIMNGVGKNMASSVGINTVKGNFNSYGTNGAAPLGAGIAGSVFSNRGAEDHSATTQFEKPQQYRAARMALLQPDRISLKIAVPYNPTLHAGNMINVTFPTKEQGVEFEFGSGDYMIVSLTHDLRVGGYGLTAMDLVARTVGSGVV